jgi:hypothetical protein
MFFAISKFLKEAASIPLTMLAAALPLFRRQMLPAPWMRRSSNDPPLPLIIYGASFAIDCLAIKLAVLANVHPLIAICGGTISYVSSLLKPELGDTIVDYRQGFDVMKIGVKAALKGLVARKALDTISENGTWIPLSQMLDPKDSQIPGMRKQPNDPDSVYGDVDFACVMMRYVAGALSMGDFAGHPIEFIPGGLDGVETGLRKLQRGEARGVKYVYRIAETRSLT